MSEIDKESIPYFHLLSEEIQNHIRQKDKDEARDQYFIECCYKRDLKGVSLLIKEGVDINKGYIWYGMGVYKDYISSYLYCPPYTPLKYAILTGRDELAQLLKEHGAKE
jgi:hypothetical protein